MSDTSSPGGVELVHVELADMAGDIFALQAMVNRIAARIHAMGIAA